MRRSLVSSLRVALLSVILASSAAQSIPSPTVVAQPVARKGKKVPTIAFHGKLSTIDVAVGSFTLGHKTKGGVIYISPRTRITRAGRRATLSDAVLGDEVSGRLIKRADGKREALSLRLGPKENSSRSAEK